MTRSTVKPDTIKLWQVKQTEEGLKLDISATWDAKEITVEDDHGSRQEWEYNEIRFVTPYIGSREAVEAFLSAQEARILLVAKTLWEAKHDVSALSADEAKELADYATQERVRAALHPVAGAGEEIKALRAEIRDLRKIVGGEATPGFQQLEDLVAASIFDDPKKE